ncbi:hypothetical protein [Streptomyces sp. NPDC058653]
MAFPFPIGRAGDIAPGRSATPTAPSKAGESPRDRTIHPFMKGTPTV